MTKVDPHPFRTAAPSPSAIIALVLIAGTTLTALLLAVAVMLAVSNTSTGWTGFSIGTFFGVSCILSAVLIFPRGT